MPQIVRNISHSDRIAFLRFMPSKPGSGAKAFRDMIRRARALAPKTRDVAAKGESLSDRMRAAADRHRIGRPISNP